MSYACWIFILISPIPNVIKKIMQLHWRNQNQRPNLEFAMQDSMRWIVVYKHVFNTHTCYERLKNHIGHYHNEHPVHIVKRKTSVYRLLYFPLIFQTNGPKKKKKVHYTQLITMIKLHSNLDVATLHSIYIRTQFIIVIGKRSQPANHQLYIE